MHVMDNTTMITDGAASELIKGFVCNAASLADIARINRFNSYSSEIISYRKFVDLLSSYAS